MANVTLSDVRKIYPGGVEAIKGISLNVARRAVLRAGRPVGLRQVDAAAHDRGARDHDLRQDRYRRAHRQRYRAGGPRHRHGVPELRALSAHERLQQHGLWPAQSRHGRSRDQDARATKPRRFSRSASFSTASRAQLSGGQRQRVAMGRAIVRQPKAFLFDEPLSNLDAKLRIAMRIEIRKLQRRLSTTSIYVTHDQLEAMTLADMLVVMNGGIVEQAGKPIEIYRRPETTFVASFIGAPPMNLLSLKAVAAPSAATPACRRMPASSACGPEDLSFSSGGRPDGGITLDLRVDAVERIGAETLRLRPPRGWRGHPGPRAGRRRAADRRHRHGGGLPRQAACVHRRRPAADRPVGQPIDAQSRSLRETLASEPS